jgi:hypothetical protein
VLDLRRVQDLALARERKVCLAAREQHRERHREHTDRAILREGSFFKTKPYDVDVVWLLWIGWWLVVLALIDIDVTMVRLVEIAVALISLTLLTRADTLIELVDSAEFEVHIRNSSSIVVDAASSVVLLLLALSAEV